MAVRTVSDQARREGQRPVVATMFMTLDGYIVGPDEDVSWVQVGFDPEMLDDLAQVIADRSDTFVLGRTTYEIFAAYWPTAIPFAEGDEVRVSEGKEDPRIIRALNDYPKLVVSTTMAAAAWRNTRVIAGGLEDEIRRLKAQPGRAICLQGSASVVQALARADLVDEYLLYVHPVLLGAGKKLFACDTGRQNLELAHIKPYSNGVVAMTYRRKAVA